MLIITLTEWISNNPAVPNSYIYEMVSPDHFMVKKLSGQGFQRTIARLLQNPLYENYCWTSPYYGTVYHFYEFRRT